jgi:hypothetical protein
MTTPMLAKCRRVATAQNPPRQYGRHCHRICDYADRMTAE